MASMIGISRELDDSERAMEADDGAREGILELVGLDVDAGVELILACALGLST